jgi:hypothetical protein
VIVKALVIDAPEGWEPKSPAWIKVHDCWVAPLGTVVPDDIEPATFAGERWIELPEVAW